MGSNHLGASGPQAVLAVIVLYHPPPHTEDLALQLAPQVRRLVIVDNTPAGASWAHSDRLRALDNLTWVGFGENRGIAHALNAGALVDVEQQCGWYATFDQDSTVEPDFISRMLGAMATWPGVEKVGMVVPAMPWERPGPRRSTIRRAITSGAIVRFDVLRAAGGFREDYFIDYVDFEFCIRLRKLGYDILRNGEVTLGHQIGDPTTKIVFGARIVTTNHAPVRRYFKCRNRMAMVKEHYAAEPLWLSKELLSTGWEMLKIAMLERGKVEKLRMMTEGLLDGLAGRLGPRHSRSDSSKASPRRESP
jgi:rhamnosyltransferase